MSNPSEKRPTDLNVKATSFGEEVRTKAKNAGKSPEEQDNAAQIATQAYLTAYDKDLQPRKHLTEDEKEAYAKAYASARVDGKSGNECRNAGIQAANKRREDRKAYEELQKKAKEAAAQDSVEDCNYEEPNGTCINTVNAQSINTSNDQAESQLERRQVFCSLLYSITDEDELTLKKQTEEISLFLYNLKELGLLLMSMYAYDAIRYGEQGSNKEKDKVAKAVLNMNFPVIHEQAEGSEGLFSPTSDTKLFKQSFVRCSDLRVSDLNQKLQFGETAKKRLDQGLDDIYNALKHGGPYEVIIDIGGHCELEDFVYATCYLFSDEELVFQKSGKQKKRIVNPSKKTNKTIFEYVNTKWKAKFDELKTKKKCKFRLNIVTLFECNRIHLAPPTGPKGWKAIVEFFKENWTWSDTADLAEFVPTIGGFVQIYRWWNKENTTWEEGVSALMSIIPQNTAAGAMAKRIADPNYNVSELVHFQLTVLSLVPVAYIYVPALAVDVLLHFIEFVVCYDNKDRKGCVEHAKAMLADVLSIIPIWKALQAKKLGRFFKTIEAKRKRLTILSERLKRGGHSGLATEESVRLKKELADSAKTEAASKRTSLEKEWGKSKIDTKGDPGSKRELATQKNAEAKKIKDKIPDYDNKRQELIDSRDNKIKEKKRLESLRKNMEDRDAANRELEDSNGRLKMWDAYQDRYKDNGNPILEEWAQKGINDEKTKNNELTEKIKGLKSNIKKESRADDPTDLTAIDEKINKELKPGIEADESALKDLDKNIPEYRRQEKQVNDLENEAKKLNDEADLMELEAKAKSSETDAADEAELLNLQNQLKTDTEIEWVVTSKKHQEIPSNNNVLLLEMENKTFTYQQIYDKAFSKPGMELAKSDLFFGHEFDNVKYAHVIDHLKYNYSGLGWEENMLSFYLPNPFPWTLDGEFNPIFIPNALTYVSYVDFVKSSFGLMIKRKESENNSEAEKYEVEELEFTISDIIKEAIAGTALDLIYLPSDIMAFLICEDSNKPFASEAEAIDYAKKELGLIPIKGQTHSIFDNNQN